MDGISQIQFQELDPFKTLRIHHHPYKVANSGHHNSGGKNPKRFPEEENPHPQLLPLLNNFIKSITSEEVTGDHYGSSFSNSARLIKGTSTKTIIIKNILKVSFLSELGYLCISEPDYSNKKTRSLNLFSFFSRMCSLNSCTDIYRRKLSFASPISIFPSYLH